MWKRPLLRLVPDFAMVLAGSPVTAATATRPNVLFIAIDDLRPNLGCYGDPVAITPHLDRLAARGTVFRRAYCQQAVCNPSRQSLLSGRRPDSLRVWGNDAASHFRKTAPDVVPLPEFFKRNGYFAQSFGKIYHGFQGMSDPPSWSVPEEFDTSRSARTTCSPSIAVPNRRRTGRQPHSNSSTRRMMPIRMPKWPPLPSRR